MANAGTQKAKDDIWWQAASIFAQESDPIRWLLESLSAN